MQHSYKTHNTCSTNITFDLEGEIVRNVAFAGGCNGNLKAIGTLVEGFTVRDIREKLAGTSCGRNPTSCADQLAQAVQKAYDEER